MTNDELLWRIGLLVVGQIGVNVALVIGAYIKIRERLARIEAQLDPLWEEFTSRRSAARARRE